MTSKKLLRLRFRRDGTKRATDLFFENTYSWVCNLMSMGLCGGSGSASGVVPKGISTARHPQVVSKMTCVEDSHAIIRSIY